MTIVLENERERVVVETADVEYNRAVSTDGRELYLVTPPRGLPGKYWWSEDGELFRKVNRKIRARNIYT